jgi:hypothetical protein
MTSAVSIALLRSHGVDRRCRQRVPDRSEALLIAKTAVPAQEQPRLIEAAFVVRVAGWKAGTLTALSVADLGAVVALDLDQGAGERRRAQEGHVAEVADVLVIDAAAHGAFDGKLVVVDAAANAKARIDRSDPRCNRPRAVRPGMLIGSLRPNVNPLFSRNEVHESPP